MLAKQARMMSQPALGGGTPSSTSAAPLGPDTDSHAFATAKRSPELMSAGAAETLGNGFVGELAGDARTSGQEPDAEQPPSLLDSFAASEELGNAKAALGERAATTQASIGAMFPDDALPGFAVAVSCVQARAQNDLRAAAGWIFLPHGPAVLATAGATVEVSKWLVREGTEAWTAAAAAREALDGVFENESAAGAYDLLGSVRDGMAEHASGDGGGQGGDPARRKLELDVRRLAVAQREQADLERYVEAVRPLTGELARQTQEMGVADASFEIAGQMYGEIRGDRGLFEALAVARNASDTLRGAYDASIVQIGAGLDAVRTSAAELGAEIRETLDEASAMMSDLDAESGAGEEHEEAAGGVELSDSGRVVSEEQPAQRQEDEDPGGFLGVAQTRRARSKDRADAARRSMSEHFDPDRCKATSDEATGLSNGLDDVARWFWWMTPVNGMALANVAAMGTLRKTLGGAFGTAGDAGSLLTETLNREEACPSYEDLALARGRYREWVAGRRRGGRGALELDLQALELGLVEQAQIAGLAGWARQRAAAASMDASKAAQQAQQLKTSVLVMCGFLPPPVVFQLDLPGHAGRLTAGTTSLQDGARAAEQAAAEVEKEAQALSEEIDQMRALLAEELATAARVEEERAAGDEPEGETSPWGREARAMGEDASSGTAPIPRVGVITRI